MGISYKWWVDKLDCSKSPRRQKMDCPYDAALKLFNELAHVVVIDRGCRGDFDHSEHFEIGYRTMDSAIDFFYLLRFKAKKCHLY